MAQIIKLTVVGGIPLYVNVDYIRTFIPQDENASYGARLDINDGGDCYTRVMETPEQICEMINGGTVIFREVKEDAT